MLERASVDRQRALGVMRRFALCLESFENFALGCDDFARVCDTLLHLDELWGLPRHGQACYKPRRMTAKAPITPFDCPVCGAQYKLVRVEDKAAVDRQITCRSCGGPLQGRDGRFILKYFMVSRPRVQAQRQRRG
jgi:predicted RNA-binding Zn-ribbon protein involved in translation (DUF1610 family)